MNTRFNRTAILGTLLSTAVCLTLTARVRAQVVLQGFYWDVPSPAAGTASAPWWWDHLAERAKSLHDAGFTAIWIPSVTKGASGGYSVGYDPSDDYDIGSKLQRRTTATRYGTREQVERCVAMLRANNLNCIEDLVENHRNGDLANGPFHFVYKNAYDEPTGGRFEKFPTDFHPNVPDDPNVPDNGPQFGRDLPHINGEGHRVFNGLIDSCDWLTRALDIQGYRLDFVKGNSTEWLTPFMNSKSMKGKFAVGEFWDTDRDKVERWIQSARSNAGVENLASAFDFPLQKVLRSMCGKAVFDMRALDHAGLQGIDPMHSVTFAENHDTDRSDGNKIVTNKMLAYANILTSEGYPCVFYRDYSRDSGCYGMQPRIDPLIHVHERLAKGASLQRWMDVDLFVFERLGGSHLLVGLNRGSTARRVSVATGFGRNVILHEYIGVGQDVSTDGSGMAAITIPPNNDGAGYVCYAPAGIDISTPQAKALAVSQEYEGAADLDIPPASSASTTQVCRIYAAAGTTISAAIRSDVIGWSSQTDIEAVVEGPGGSRVSGKLKKSGGASNQIHLDVKSTGWYRFTVQAHSPPIADAALPFILRVTYTAPKRL